MHWMLITHATVKLRLIVCCRKCQQSQRCVTNIQLANLFVYPRNDLSYAGNFLHMMFSTPCEEYTVNPVLERAMDRILILHADHEQNASTSTVRTAGSSGANPFACIAAGIASLWGLLTVGLTKLAYVCWKRSKPLSTSQHLSSALKTK